MAFPSPAKLNLFLAITGRRADGFHDLLSLVAPLAWGDTLHVTPAAEFKIACDQPDVPKDDTNLVMMAARAFREATGWQGGAIFLIEKLIPVGAGLGGGSSNAVAALRALNQLAGYPLSAEALTAVAVRLGSDCALFLHNAPVVMRGRGDRVEPTSPRLHARLRGRRVLIFKPSFGISTPWAYQQLAARAPASYVSSSEAERRLASWLEDALAPAEDLLFNQLEDVAFAKYLALPALFAALRARFRVVPRMSGSGSACFALLPGDVTAERVQAVVAAIREGWGPEAFIVDTTLA